MKAIDIMTANVVTVAAGASVYDAARLLLGRRVSALPVLDAGGTLVGIVSESDLMRRPELRSERQHSWWWEVFASDLRQASAFLRDRGQRVSDVMTREVVSARPGMSLRELAELMERHGIKRLPVLDGQRLVGVVSRRDMLRALLALEPAGDGPIADDRVIRQRLLEEMKHRHWAGSIIDNVIVDQGVVHLWGEAATPQEIDACRVLAERVEGVRAVASHMVQVKTVI